MGKMVVEAIYGRDQLADYLENIAAQLRSGSLHTEAGQWQVPDTFEVETHLKEKKDSVRLKLEIHWHSVEGSDLTRGDVITEHPSFKQIKKDLARSFKQLKLSVNQGISIDDKVLAELAAHSRAFAALAEPEWEEPLREYMDHLDNLFRAVEKGNKELVLHEVHDLQNRMVACHKELG